MGPEDLACLDMRLVERPSFVLADVNPLSPSQAATWLVTHTGQLPDDLREAVLGPPLFAEPTPEEQRPVRPPVAVPLPAAEHRPCPVELRGPDEPVVVLGQEKPPLPPAAYAVIEVLVAAYPDPEGLTGEELDNAAGGYTDSRTALRDLRKDDHEWKRVLDFPGPGRRATKGTGRRGYRIIHPEGPLPRFPR
jgi:hypothetical protein